MQQLTVTFTRPGSRYKDCVYFIINLSDHRVHHFYQQINPGAKPRSDKRKADSSESFDALDLFCIIKSTILSLYIFIVVLK